MSRITWVWLVTNTSIEPPVPAGTSAALATTFPVKEFSVETNGRDCPVGDRVRKLSGPAGTTVTFSE
jgi:hypothetical protein